MRIVQHDKYQNVTQSYVICRVLLRWYRKEHRFLEVGSLRETSTQKFHILFSKLILSKSPYLGKSNFFKKLLSQNINSLNIFRRIRKNAKKKIGKVMSVYLSVPTSFCVSAQLCCYWTVDGFSWNCKLVFQDMSRKFSNY